MDHYRRGGAGILPGGRPVAGLVLALALLAGCAETAAPATDAAATPPAPGGARAGFAVTVVVPTALPGCAPAPTPVARPADFPAHFPLPAGAVITRVERRAQGPILYVLAPGDSVAMAIFLDGALRAARYKQGQGEAERGEAESTFGGEGYQGRWLARNVANCPGAVMLTVFAAVIPPP